MKDEGGHAFPTPHGSGNRGDYHTEYSDGMTLRDYFAAHSVQPGAGEITAMAGLTYSVGSVWLDSNTRSASFENWFNGLPLEERLDLFARVKYAMADAMLKARNT